ncbi:MAG: hypothetical protein VR70_11750 [Rhodospirillaceae bacterium BRH_c57]|nr:MAG: hypothetical protein VR70_11750 [Rhodospirillaceae bacterium BRH_c57]
MSNSIRINQHFSLNQSTSTSNSRVSESSSTSFKSDVNSSDVNGGDDAEISVSVTNSAGTASFEGTGSHVSVEIEDDGRPVVLIDGEDEDVEFNDIDDGDDPAPDFEADGPQDDGVAQEGGAQEGGAQEEDAEAAGFDLSVVESLDLDADGGHAMQTVSVMSAFDLFLS